MSEVRRLEREPVNAFTYSTAAARYARSRPYFHPVVMSNVRDALGLREPVRRALDVGCGTGQSTVALRDFADVVVGVDSSPTMLAHAPQDAGLTFVVAPAEQLPFASGTVDLMTVASAFHWFDRERFLNEAHRLLRPSAWLVVYDNAFLDIMEDHPDFANWVREAYVARYPAPSRDRRSLTPAEVHRQGFHLREPETYTNAVAFSPAELVDYLMTQSNVIAAVEEGGEPLEDARGWLLSAVTPFFPGPRGTFRFGGVITYLQKR